MVVSKKRTIYACDIGTTRRSAETGLPSFAWARVNPEEGVIQASSDIDKLVKHLQSDIRQGYSVALGFEAPLFIPVPVNTEHLSKSREGDGNRSWSASSGAGVTVLGIHQSAWILRSLYKSSHRRCDFTLDWQQHWPPVGNRPVLLCWEAFVSGAAHSELHLTDAVTAVDFFYRNEAKLRGAREPVYAEQPVSLIGSVALWSGWVSDIRFIHEPTLVIKPKKSFNGKYQIFDSV
jgi:hypothetical protein